MKQVLLNLGLVLLASTRLAGATLSPPDPAVPALAFDAGNKQYEQGHYREAATTFESLLRARPGSEVLYYNLGNAWFKAGQTGRAIAAWRQAERLNPRDPSIRFNLQFARRKVAGSDAVLNPAWQRALTALTLNEWTVLTALTLDLWFCLLALREFRPGLRAALRGYTATAGLTALALVGCVGAAAHLRFRVTPAVVVIPEALARTGPLEEAKVLYQFRDGTELTVLDQKDLANGEQTQSWLQVQDAAKRVGWLKRDQVTLLN